MFRFIALIWDAADPRASDAARWHKGRLQQTRATWGSALSSRGTTVLYDGARAGSSGTLLLPQDKGVVLGTTFSRGHSRDGEPANKKEVFSEKETEDILATGGRKLIESYWGRYVAILSYPQMDRTWVLRDPSGALPCFTTTVDDVLVYFSYMGDCVSLGLQSFSINWDYIAAQLLVPLIQTTETGLNEVSEVQAGECHEIVRGRVSRSLYWNPLRVAENIPTEDATEAANLLRNTTKACVQSWASCYTGVLHRVSGGLDSSIVLACLRDAPSRPEITCLTYFSPREYLRLDVDERRYARLCTQHCGVELVELERNPRANLATMLEMAWFASPPIFRDRNVEVDRIESQLASQRGAHGLFGGSGGDQLFCHSPVIASVEDYLRHHGISMSLFRLALNVARREGISVWHILGQAAHGSFFRHSRTPWDDTYESTPLVSDAVVHSVKNHNRFLPSWFDTAGKIPRGKLAQAFAIAIPTGFYSAVFGEQDPEPVEPLLSQPLMELCLGLPTYVLAHRGLKRGLARNAFAEDIPREIAVRRSKGGIAGFIKSTLTNNLPFAREMLLEGLLVEQGLLKRELLEQALSGGIEANSFALETVFDLLGVEAWAGRWRSVCGSEATAGWLRATP